MHVRPMGLDGRRSQVCEEHPSPAYKLGCLWRVCCYYGIYSKRKSVECGFDNTQEQNKSSEFRLSQKGCQGSQVEKNENEIEI